VTYLEENKKKQEEFGMVVLSKQLEIRPEFRAIHEKVGGAIR
jgi:hypothetical protein